MRSVELDRALDDTFEWIAGALAGCRYRWWIIAGAAAVLHGVAEPSPTDIDVLLDERDAPSVLTELGLPLEAGEPSDHYRSRWFATWSATPLRVEFMSDFAVCTNGGWQSIAPCSHVAVRSGRSILFVPERRELAKMLRLFGRPKDLARAIALDAIS